MASKTPSKTLDHDVEHIDEKVPQALEGEQVDEDRDLTLKTVLRKHPWIMINGAMIGVPAFRRDFGYMSDGKAILPASWQTAFNSVSSVGQFFGGFLCSWACDRIGRRASLLLGLVITTGGILGEVLSSTNAAFVVSKLILGFGLGFYLTLGPLATSEIAPVALRGIATAGVNLGIAIGQLISNGVVKGFGERDDRWAYRGPFAIQLFFVVVLGLGLPFTPETPWYLVRRGRIDEARKSLRKLYGPDTDIDSRVAHLQRTVAEEDASSSETPSMMQCLKGTDLTRTTISIGVFICQHMSGIIFVLGYSTYFFQLAGLSNAHSFNLGVGVTACGVLGNFCSWFFINSFGRRRSFLLGMAVLDVLLLLIGIMDVVPTAGAQWVQAACTVVYAFAYFGTIGAMAFAVLGETSSTTLRAPTMALATATQALVGMAMNIVIPYLVNPDEANLRGKVGFIFGGLCTLATVWSFFFVPELKGKSYYEIDRLFQARVPPRKMGQYKL